MFDPIYEYIITEEIKGKKQRICIKYEIKVTSSNKDDNNKKVSVMMHMQKANK